MTFPNFRLISKKKMSSSQNAEKSCLKIDSFSFGGAMPEIKRS